MGRKKLLIEETTRVLTMLENGIPVICLAANLHVSRQAIYDQLVAAKLPSGTTTPRKVVTGAKKKTTTRTDALIRHEVMMYPSVTAASLKKNMHKFSRRCLLGLSSTVCKRIRKCHVADCQETSDN